MRYDLFHRAGGDYLFLVSADETTVEKELAEWYDVHPDEKLLVVLLGPLLEFGEGEYGEGRFANDNGMGGMA
jgi:hypothetical protein